jgi:hypothetical protein
LWIPAKEKKKKSTKKGKNFKQIRNDPDEN